MSIRAKILIPMLTILAFTAASTILMACLGSADRQAIAEVAIRALDADGCSRRANDDFERADAVIAYFVPMTHFVEPQSIARDFTKAASAMASDLANLESNALSEDMPGLTKKADSRFAAWRQNAEGVVGLAPMKDIAKAHVIRVQGEAVKASQAPSSSRATSPSR